MRVLMINAIYGSRSSGRSMKELADKLRSEGNEVFVASPLVYNGDCDFYRIGTDFDHKAHAFLSRLWGKQAYYSKGATKKLLKLVDEKKPDVIHVQVLHGNYIHFNYFFKEVAKRKIPVVFVLDDCWLFTGKCSHFTSANCYKWQTGCNNCPQLQSCNPTWFFDRTKKMYNDKKAVYDSLEKFGVVAVSDWLLGEAKKSIMGKANVIKRIYNSIDVDAFKPLESDLRQKLGLEDKFVVLGVATCLDESKGLSLFKDLASKMPENYRIVFVGGLPQNTELPENIMHVGHTESVEELAKYYSMADVFVQMSVEETFGKVTAEALSCGTPAVVFNSTANPELIGEGCGYVATPKDVDEVLKKLKQIENDGKGRYTDKCRQFIVKSMNKETTLNEFIKVYKELIEE